MAFETLLYDTAGPIATITLNRPDRLNTIGPTQRFMSMWRTPKPVIAQVHGWCVGGGSDMALCADLIIAAEDAQIGTPYSRVWGCYLSGLWLYRLQQVSCTSSRDCTAVGQSVVPSNLDPIPLAEHAPLITIRSYASTNSPSPIATNARRRGRVIRTSSSNEPNHDPAASPNAGSRFTGRRA